MAWKWMFFFRKERNWDTSNPVAERSPKEIRIGILNQSLDKFSQGSKSTRLPGRYATQGQSHTQWGLPAIQCKMHPVHQLIWTNKDIVFDLFPNLHVCLSASSFYKIYIYICHFTRLLCISLPLLACQPFVICGTVSSKNCAASGRFGRGLRLPTTLSSTQSSCWLAGGMPAKRDVHNTYTIWIHISICTEGNNHILQLVHALLLHSILSLHLFQG